MLDTVLSTVLLMCTVFLEKLSPVLLKKNIDNIQILHQDSQSSCFATHDSESTKFSKYASENAVFVNLILQFYWSLHTVLPES